MLNRLGNMIGHVFNLQRKDTPVDHYEEALFKLDELFYHFYQLPEKEQAEILKQMNKYIKGS